MTLRIRTIKPEFWNDKKVASWDFFTRLFYIGLWSAADDHGRGSAEPARLAASLFPYDLAQKTLVTLQKILEGLQQIKTDACIRLYTVRGEEFYQIINWKRHQYIQRPSKSLVPNEVGDPQVISDDSPENSGDPQEFAVREQGTGNREQGREKEEVLESVRNGTKTERLPKPDTLPRTKNNTLETISKLKTSLAEMYKRKPMIVWPQSEEAALVEICRRPGVFEEFQELRNFRAASDAKFFPKSVDGLLQGWDRTLDRARQDNGNGENLTAQQMIEDAQR